MTSNIIHNILTISHVGYITYSNYMLHNIFWYIAKQKCWELSRKGVKLRCNMLHKSDFLYNTKTYVSTPTKKNYKVFITWYFIYTIWQTASPYLNLELHLLQPVLEGWQGLCTADSVTLHWVHSKHFLNFLCLWFERSQWQRLILSNASLVL